MSGKNLVVFDTQLLYHIKNNENAEAKSMLSENLVKEHDEFGTLLHYATRHGNVAITRYLLELGSEVDAIGKDGSTPLAVATARSQEEIVGILLKAGANIDIADDSGKSPLQMLLQSDGVYEPVLQRFMRKVQAVPVTVEELVSKLVGDGCTLYHATYTENVQILKCMLARGFDVNSRGPYGKTALIATAEQNYLALMKWLVSKGADVTAVDEGDNGPLIYAAEFSDKEMLEFLLEQGANPNERSDDWATPLSLLLSRSQWFEKLHAERVELLLLCGAVIPPYMMEDDGYTIFDRALLHENFQVINVLTCHFAMLEKLGTPSPKFFIYCNEEEYREALSKIEKNYELCRQTLNVKVFGSSTLFDLLMKSDEQMKIYARNEKFLPKIKRFFFKHNLRKLCSYYYSKLKKSIARADHLVKLENTAIPVICDLFDGDYNQCYVAARRVCYYLNDIDLVQLSQLQK